MKKTILTGNKKSKHIKRVELQLLKYKIAYKCRSRWRRRHLKTLNFLAQVKADPIGESIYAKYMKFDKLFTYIQFEKSREKTQ